MKKLLVTGAFAALISAGGVLAFTAPASAYVVCNRDGDCWHTETRVRYPSAGYTYHNDDWYFHQSWTANQHYRDYHKERGYYRGGLWVTF